MFRRSNNGKLSFLQREEIYKKNAKIKGKKNHERGIATNVKVVKLG